MGPTKVSKNPVAKEQLEKISLKAKEAAQVVKDQLRSVTIAIDERVAIEDHINNISREMEYMLDGIDDISRVNQKKILAAYKKFLEENLDAVSSRLNRLK